MLGDHSRLVLSAFLPDGDDEERPGPRSPDPRRIRHPGVGFDDNGAIENAASRGGRSSFESDLLALGVLDTHSRPCYPRTESKVERWHRTLPELLARRPAATLDERELILDAVVTFDPRRRVHR